MGHLCSLRSAWLHEAARWEGSARDPCGQSGGQAVGRSGSLLPGSGWLHLPGSSWRILLLLVPGWEGRRQEHPSSLPALPDAANPGAGPQQQQHREWKAAALKGTGASLVLRAPAAAFTPHADRCQPQPWDAGAKTSALAGVTRSARPAHPPTRGSCGWKTPLGSLTPQVTPWRTAQLCNHHPCAHSWASPQIQAPRPSLDT